MALALIITDAGRAALVAANQGGTNAVRIASVGVSATAIAATTGTAALPDEIKRIATVSGAAVASDTIHLVVRDETATAYTVRSFALYLTDGTMFAAYGQADPIIAKTAASLVLLAIDVKFADIAAAQIQFGDANFLNPPATTDTAGVVELATAAEAVAGDDTTRAVTPAAAKAAVPAWIGYTPANRAGDSFSGPVQFPTPGAGSTGGVRIRGHAVLGLSILQFLTPDGSGQWGYLSCDAVGVPRWSGNVLWHAGNDGSGSGADADLLDGQEGAWYADVRSRLGYVPANRAGDTFSGPVGFQTPNSGSTGAVRILGNAVSGSAILQVLTPDGGGQWGYLRFTADGVMRWNESTVWHAGNDGSGSGSDADLLDGQHGAWYADIVSRLGYTPVNRAGDAVGGTLRVDAGNGGAQLSADGTIRTDRGPKTGVCYFGSDGTRYLYADGGSYQLPGAPLYVNDGLVITLATDGSGCGFDADLLDGQQGGWYADVKARLGYTPVNSSGDTVSGTLRVDAGNGGAQLSADGTIRTDRGPKTGVCYFGSDGTRYLYSDDGSYQLPGAELFVNGGHVVTLANDGPGSGVDADTVDGIQGADLMPKTGGKFVGTVFFEDDNFSIFIDGSGNPSIYFANGVAFGYDRARGRFNFGANGRVGVAIDPVTGNVQARGTITQNVTSLP